MTNHPQTIGLLSPGDMGHVVGQVLGQHGLKLITCLEGRSERTKILAQQANVVDLGSYETLVREADLILSILVPAQAMAAAELVAQAIRQTQAEVTYIDCNAIAPATVQAMSVVVNEAGGHFIDASIIGPPPRQLGRTCFYASGPAVDRFAALNDFGLSVVVLGKEIGQASAIKMCYAALTKGTTALCTELMVAAKVLGVSEALTEEFQLSQEVMLKRMQGLPSMPMKSRRWIGEMEEIAKTFEGVGLTPNILTGAADMYRFVGQTELADRMPEDSESLPSLAEMIGVLAEALRL